MESRIKSVFKNDRYKIIQTEDGQYFLLDTDDRKISIVFFLQNWFGYHKVIKI
ncbi:MAG: hypothetical protein LBS33_07190, partial [Streptococcaceae bacterium]|nr:hypothetical protein [Streptococcaceae bacterium]